MVTGHNADFGRLDGWVARRLMRRGPNGVTQLLEGTDPVLWAVVAHKWNREPGIRKLRFLAMRMGLLKQISPEDYQYPLSYPGNPSSSICYPKSHTVINKGDFNVMANRLSHPLSQ